MTKLTTLYGTKEFPALTAKQLWGIFTTAYENYAQKPFTPRGQEWYEVFQAAKKELKQRGEGWWGS